MALLAFLPKAINVVMGTVDDIARLKGGITGEANRWVAANSRNEPAMAQDYYSFRKHQNENIIPAGSSNIHSGERKAYIACRVVGGGAAGGGLARGWNYLTAGGNDSAPNPDHHWCLVVGDYLHQLQATSLNGGDNYYTNEIYHQQEGGWKQYAINTTTYNDVAIRNAAVEVMNSMPETYDLLNNNCQTFTLRLLDRIIKDGRRAQMQGNRTFGLMKSPEIKLLPSDLVITKINDDGTTTEVDGDLVPVVVKEKKQPIVVEPVKRPDVQVTEIGVEQEEEAMLSREAKERLQALLDAMKIMDRETPVIQLGQEEAAEQ